MNPITIPNITIPTIGLPAIGIPSVGFPSASGGGLVWPTGMEEHIKAIYDPAKQGMTNYDVIEAYVEDFTTWNYFSSRGSATVTKNKIIITKSFSNKQNIIEDNKSPYDDIKIYVTGISEDNPLTINQYVDNKWVRLHTYTTDGIYIVKNRNLYVGFGTYTTDDCNITITQLPTSILKDLSGNGNHAYLYGGKGKLNSGMGVYQQDFTNTRNATTVSSDGFEVAKKGGTYLARISIGYWNNKECKLLFETNNTTQFYYIRYRKANNDIVATVRLYNGENIIPAQDDLTDVSEVIFEGIVGDNEYIRVTEIPNYPNQLCYDGKMYAVCYGFPILTDYTVMADRTWFDKDRGCFAGKRQLDDKGAFVFEEKTPTGNVCYSFGLSTSIDFVESGISWQTTTSYNGQTVNKGNKTDTDFLLIGGGLYYPEQDLFSELYIGCHGKIIIADRSFTEDEITWLKDNWKKI